MVSVPTHSSFASHRRSPPAPCAEHGYRGDQPDELVAAIVQGGSRPRPLHRSAGRQPARCRVLAQCHGAAGSGSSVPRLDATVASSTIPESIPPCAQPPAPAAKRGRVSPHNLGGPQPAVGFERRQTALPRRQLPPLFWRHICATFGPQDRQKGLRPHRQSHVAIPPAPAAHFVVIQTHFAFGGLDTFFDRPAHPRHSHQVCRSGVCRSKGDIGGHLARIAQTAAEEQPALPSRLHRIAQLQAVNPSISVCVEFRSVWLAILR